MGGASECSKVKYKAKPLSEMPSQMTQQPGESAARCKNRENDASVTRLPGNDESSNNPISEEEWFIGRRFSVEEERRVDETSPSHDVAEMHKVMSESDWPDK